MERDFYRILNSCVEPWVRAGAGAPFFTPVGLIVLETIGRSSGHPTRTPLVATLLGQSLVAGTFRGPRSHWVRNAVANPAVRYWLGGREYLGVATIISTAASVNAETIPAELTGFVDAVLGPATHTGWAFVVITLASLV